ncbi:MAG: ribosome rescue protein RqcH [Candidatus Aenigmatarchaeota archaeon]
MPDQKSEMSSLDIRFLVKELQFLKGGRIDNIYQNNSELRIRIYVPKYGNYELFANATCIHLTQHKRNESLLPSNFAMLLRKHLCGQSIRAIEQHKFDRVVEIAIGDKLLIIEMFHDGNIILCDHSYIIMMPLHYEEWKDRKIASYEKYIWPKSLEVWNYMPFKRAFEDERKVAAVLATIGFGEYANEIVKLAGVDASRPAQQLSEKEIDGIFDIVEDFLLKKNINAVIYYDGDIAISTTPFEMSMYENLRKEKYDSLNKALDTYFSEKLLVEKEEAGKEIKDEKLGKQTRILEQQEGAVEKYEEKAHEEFDVAKSIYNNYALVEKILATLNETRVKYSWDEIKEMLKKDESPEAKAILEIKEHENIVTINLDGNSLDLFINRTTEENASHYYDGSKHAKKKMERAGEALEGTKERIEEIKEETLEEAEEEKPEVEEESEAGDIGEPQEALMIKKRGRWYHKYHYFWSLEGLLVVAGKDDTTNEELIKKHIEPDDIILHADIHGAPFVVIKQRRDKREHAADVTPQGIIEAAEFAASYSKAWQMGLGSVEVYWIKPEQVTKHASAGQFLPKGSFTIEGQRNYLKSIKLRLCIGVSLQHKCFLIGPVKSIAARSDYYLSIQPGEIQSHELVKKIRERLESKALYPDEKELISSLSTDYIEARIPAGKASIIEF